MRGSAHADQSRQSRHAAHARRTQPGQLLAPATGPQQGEIEPPQVHRQMIDLPISFWGLISDTVIEKEEQQLLRLEQLEQANILAFLLEK